ncbi:hypothetical protein DITRI_Ditri12bG0005200 [Diplodiscus trichospermus]
MAFWGTEVKPGRPFTHSPLSRRLHLSQATLGMGSSTHKTIVQCNVGNKRAVYVCCLFPEKAECCQLNLEFDESDEVVFSVIGPRTVHLTGYYLPTSSLNHHNDDSESYGEDIAETETERSENSEENEYGGSFINDDDPEVFSSSPESSAGSGSNEEILDLNKSKDGKGKRIRLRKKYKHGDSENGDSTWQKNLTSVAAIEVLDSEMEDTLPISSLSRRKHASDGGKAAVEEKARKETVSLNENETQENVTTLDVTNAPLRVRPERNEEKQKVMLGVDNDLMPKKKREELPKEESYSEVDHGMIQKLVLEQNELPSKVDCKHNDFLLAFTQVGLEDGAKQKRKRKECAKEKTLKVNVSNEDEGQKSGSNLDSVAHLEEKETQKEVNDKNEEKEKHLLGVDNDLLAKKKGEELPKEESYPEADHGMIGNLVLEQNELPSEEDCKHNDFLLAATQVGLEDGAKQKRKRKEYVKEKTLKDDVSNKDEGQKNVSNLDSVAHLEDEETQKDVNHKKEEKEKHMLGVDNDLIPEEKKEELPKEESYPEADHGMTGNLVLEQNELPSKEECKGNDLLLATSQVGLENGTKLKRKRKELVKEKTLKDNVSKDDEGHKHGSNLDSIAHLEDNKETQKQVNEKKRKKKKRCTNKEDGDALKMELPVLSAHEQRSDVEMEGITVNENATKLPSGIIIEELEMGKPDGKIASLGKKACICSDCFVHVHYIGKLKESGQVFDSSAVQALSKFRLGGEKVADLWNVGLDGMRVGGKRRLTVPPSVRNEGAGENIPPDSWLVFEVELVKVR